jgi:hypothetical protein
MKSHVAAFHERKNIKKKAFIDIIKKYQNKKCAFKLVFFNNKFSKLNNLFWVYVDF